MKTNITSQTNFNFNITSFKLKKSETSLVVQWLRLCAFTEGGTGLIPGWGTKIQHAARCGPKKKKKKIIIYSAFSCARRHP